MTFDTTSLTIQTFDDSGNDRYDLAKVFRFNAEKIKELNAKGAGAYFATNPQIDPNNRLIENTAAFSRLSLDLDIAKEKEELSKDELRAKKSDLRKKLESLSIPPNFIIETKNGLQPIWEWEKPIPLPTLGDRQKANEYYQQIVRGFESVTGLKSEGDNLVRVVRFPGSLHLKNPKDPFEIKIDEVNPNKVDFEEFIAAYPPLKKAENHLESIIRGVPDGSRNNSATEVVGSLLARYPEHKWESIVWPLFQAWNRDNEPPLPEHRLRTTFESISRSEKASRLDSHTYIDAQPLKWPNPPAESAYIGLAGEVVKTIEPNSEADPVAVLLNFLAAFGSVIGNSAHFKVEADRHPMRIFGVLVGETSKGRKGTSWGYIKRIFEQIDEKWVRTIQTGLSSGEGLIWAVRDEIRKTKQNKDGSLEETLVDEGVKDKRLLVLEDEFSSTLRVMNREGNTLSAVIRRAWDTGDLQTLTKNSPAKATGAHISIIGHITKLELLRYLSDTEAGNGFGNRFLWILARRSKCLAFGGSGELGLEEIIKKVKKAVEYAAITEEITWAEETKPLWADIYPELSKGGLELIDAILGRAEAYVTRLACIYALLDREDLIRPQHLKAAVALWEYCERSLKYIFHGASGNPLADDIYHLLQNNPGGQTRKQVSDYFSRHKTSEEISQALSILKANGKAENNSRVTDGRPAEIWKVNSGEKSEVSEKGEGVHQDNSHHSLNSHHKQNEGAES